MGQQCVQLMGWYNAGNAATIGVIQGSGWSTAPPIGSAIAMWECGGVTGYGFPQFLNNTSGDIDVYVERLSGQIPQGNAGCARFDPDVSSSGVLTGGTVEVYEYDSSGQSCSWIMPGVTLDNVIAHELGHALTLGNSNCGGYIMGPDYTTADVNSEECAAVDDCWYTPPEQQEDDQNDMQNCNAMCPRQCEYTGYAWWCPGAESPILFDLDDDGFALTNIATGVWFDLNADGRPDRTAWTTAGGGDAFLCRDRNGDGRIGDGRELFGNSTPLVDGRTALHGFVVLEEFDMSATGGNDDGQLDARDRVWGSLLLWRDSNHDGISAPGELTAMPNAGVTSIDLHYVRLNYRDDYGNIFRFRSKAVVRDRKGRDLNAKIYDVFLLTDPTATRRPHDPRPVRR
jgi:hypothetical protein